MNIYISDPTNQSKDRKEALISRNLPVVHDVNIESVKKLEIKISFDRRES